MLRANLDDLPTLEHFRQAMQRHRIQMSNRASATERGASQAPTDLSEHFEKRFQDIEDELTDLIAGAVREHEMWPFFERIKGVGPGLAGSLLSMIDIERAPTVSALWKYAGQSVVEDKDGNPIADRPIAGQKLSYNKGLKKTCFLIGSSFLRSGSPYRREYDEAKEHYQTSRPTWTPGHIDMAARRKMVKLFLSHLWLEWRTIRGLDTRAPYAMTVLGHDGYKKSEDYLEPAKSAKKRKTKSQK